MPAKKNLLWKVREGVPVFRQFPAGCGRSSHLRPAISNVCRESNVEWKIDDSGIKEKYQSKLLCKRTLEGNDLGENAGQVKHESRQVVSKITNELVEEKTSDKCDVRQEDEEEEIRILSPLEWKLQQPGFSQTPSEVVPGVNVLGVTGGSNFKNCSMEKLPQHRRSSILVDLTHLAGDNAFRSGFRGELANSCSSYKGKENEIIDVDEYQSLSLKEQKLEAPGQNPNKRKAVVVAGKEYKDAVPYDIAETHASPRVDAQSNGLSIFPLDEYVPVASRIEVREALNEFEKIYNSLLQEHKTKTNEGKTGRNFHLEAAMLLKKQQKWVNSNEDFLGPVPGVEIGDWFHFRAELVIIGLHRQFHDGIHYMKKDGKIIATSIVASGRYANDVESPDVLIYSGHGGNPTIVEKKPEDQKLERGNLALKNCIDTKTPVRVIRGGKLLPKAPSCKSLPLISDKISTYIYDGLYIVTKFWQKRGQFGKLVYMFQLVRLPGQPKLAQSAMKKLRRKGKARKEYTVVGDLSQGKEKMPIRLVNEVDDDKPPPFTYIANNIYSKSYDLPSSNGCNCTDDCLDSEPCSCAIKNGGEIPFNDNGAIIRAKPIVYECGPSCKCPPSCKNRVGQWGVKFQFEVFKTSTKGWGVRSRNYIPSGRFICEYVGKLLQEKEAEQRTNNDEYLFDIGNNLNDPDRQNKPEGFSDSGSKSSTEDNGFVIDAAQFGNVGRFINHSCSPNLYAQDVLFDHDDKRMPHVMLFAAKNIPPLRELTYDYNYKLDRVYDMNGNIKKKNCYCGSHECTGRMY